jgi:hypothetical protein
MADEPIDTPTPPAEEAGAGAGATIAVEVEQDRKRPSIPDEELAKLSGGSDDEISRANDEAKRMVKGLRTAYQEQRRRAEQWSRDAATASNLADQLYRENQELRQNVTRSENALIEQALSRAQAQLETAKNKARQAQASGDADLIVAANEDVARAVAEADRLALLKPAPGQQPQQRPPAEGSDQAPPQRPQAPTPSARTRSWVESNPWFGKDQEMTNFAMRQHQHLLLDGITEESNPDLYWRTIEGKLKEQYPEKFKTEEAARPPETTKPPEGQARPVAVTGSQRSNGAVDGQAVNGKRVVRLTESQVRLAKRIGLTPEQYAAQLVREAQEEERTRRLQ